MELLISIFIFAVLLIAWLLSLFWMFLIAKKAKQKINAKEKVKNKNLDALQLKYAAANYINSILIILLLVYVLLTYSLFKIIVWIVLLIVSMALRFWRE